MSKLYEEYAQKFRFFDENGRRVGTVWGCSTRNEKPNWYAEVRVSYKGYARYHLGRFASERSARTALLRALRKALA